MPALERGRWWDGCDRAVVAVVRRRSVTSHGMANVLVLSCGHEQSAHCGKQDAVICLECARLGKREAA